jgi:uncharacterized membrane protein YgcG
VLAVTFACLPCAVAIAAPKYPDASGWVVDAAQALTAEQRGEIHQIASHLDAERLAQLAVAGVRPEDLGDLSRSEYAVELFRRWKLGHSKASSDGLLLLFVTGPAGKRGLKVEVGYGLEGVLPDGKVGALMDEVAGPRLKNGEIGAAAVALAGAFAQAIEAAGRDTGAAPPQRDNLLAPGSAVALALVPPATLLVLFAVLVLSHLRKRVPGREATVLFALFLVACLPGFVGLVAASAHWLIWALFAAMALAVVDVALYLELQESRCPRDGRWLSRHLLWGSLLVRKSCACGYETAFSFAPGSRSAASSHRTAVTGGSGWSAGGGGESGGGGADREY